jgi:hypothetical protein
MPICGAVADVAFDQELHKTRAAAVCPYRQRDIRVSAPWKRPEQPVSDLDYDGAVTQCQPNGVDLGKGLDRHGAATPP